MSLKHLETFRGRSVLVTGHTGFKGGWLAAWLGELGAQVSGYSTDPPTTPSFFDLTELGSRMHSDKRGDLRDFDAVSRVVASERPAVIFHLGAQALVPAAAREPRETFEVNFMGTVNVLEAARSVDAVEAVVVVTSDKCYRATPPPASGYAEEAPLGGDGEPYSASKAAAEVAAAVYQDAEFLEIGGGNTFAVATARAGNVIGGGDYAAHRLVPDFVRAIDQGGLALRNPAAVRPWQHVLSANRGYLDLAAALLDSPQTHAQGWNFGPGPEGEVPVQELVSLFSDRWPEASFTIERTLEKLAVETPTLRLDTAKARQELGWDPVWGLEQTVDATVTWYRQAREGASPSTLERLTREQIEQFTSAAATA